MPPKRGKFSRIGPTLAVIALLASAGIAVGARISHPFRLFVMKATGRLDRDCSWRDAIDAAHYEDSRMAARLRVARETTLVQRDGDLTQWQSPYGTSWISGAQRLGDAQFRAPDLHHWPPRWAQDSEHPVVRKGDIVIDCGGHIGESAAMALRLGASLVITVEPDPINAQAIRRNLADAIKDGRLIVIEKGVWSSSGMLNLERGEASTMSTIEESAEGGISIPVTTIDQIVQDLKLSRVDFIKMDIEGSEPRALEGARETLQRFKPRLAVGVYHEDGDREAIPHLVLANRGDYTITATRCLPAHGRIIPHELFFQ